MKKALSLLIVMIILITSAVSVYATSIYTDVSSNHWAYNDIIWATNNQLMNGIQAGKFAPNDTMTRAMVVTVLYRMEGEPPISDSLPFSDLKQDWYKNAVRWAYENEIVKGTSSSTFSPNGEITREQIATILYRYADYKGKDISTTANLSAFPDVAQISPWAKTALQWANAEGLINGTSKGGAAILDPKGNATRAQVAAILHRYNSIKDNPHIILGNYIQQNGSQDVDGTYYISKTTTSYDSIFKISVIWDPDTQSLIFALEDYAESTYCLHGVLYNYGSKQQRITSIFTMPEDNMKITGIGYINTDTYSYSNYTIYSYSCDASDISLFSKSKNFAESAIKLLFMYIDVLLEQTGTGITLNDLGFVNL